MGHLIVERVKCGIERARRNGKHLGRPRVDLDLRPAVAMLREGHGLKAVAGALGVNRGTLRRRLREHGAWPGGTEVGVNNPVVAGAA